MRVAVAGGGIAGLTAATALSARGFVVDIYERAPQLTEVGAGIQLSPNAMAVLERLGVAPLLAAQWCEPEALVVRAAATGATLLRLPLGAIARKRYGAPYCTLHRADLQAALRAVAERGAKLHLDAEMRDVRQTEAAIAFSAAGAEHEADLLVAADGVRSGIRETLFGHPGPTPYQRTAWRGTMEAGAAAGLVPLDVTGLWLGDGAHLVHYPVRAGAVLNVVVIARGSGSRPPLAPFGRSARPLLEAVNDWTPWPLLHVDARGPWSKGRAVLVGDAAHAMAPSAAQGGAQAIEDAWVLAARLAHESDFRHALARFERLRRPRVERVMRTADRNLSLYEMGSVAGTVRDALLFALPARLLLARLDWLFGWKPE